MRYAKLRQEKAPRMYQITMGFTKKPGIMKGHSQGAFGVKYSVHGHLHEFLLFMFLEAIYFLDTFHSLHSLVNWTNQTLLSHHPRCILACCFNRSK